MFCSLKFSNYNPFRSFLINLCCIITDLYVCFIFFFIKMRHCHVNHIYYYFSLLFGLHIIEITRIYYCDFIPNIQTVISLPSSSLKELLPWHRLFTWSISPLTPYSSLKAFMEAFMEAFSKPSWKHCAHDSPIRLYLFSQVSPSLPPLPLWSPPTFPLNSSTASHRSSPGAGRSLVGFPADGTLLWHLLAPHSLLVFQIPDGAHDDTAGTRSGI